MRIPLCLGALAATLFLQSATSPAGASSGECREAVDHYNSVLDDVSDTLRRYANCVSSSRGHDDCSTEFRRLKDAQADFESAVADIEGDCE